MSGRIIKSALFVALVGAGLLALPTTVTPGARVVVPAAALDSTVETVVRYLEWRAPSAMDPVLRRGVASAIVEECRAAGLDPLYVLAVMEVESDFLPDARSNAGAVGLLQLRPVTVEEVARVSGLPETAGEEPPEVTSLRVGIRYLAMLEGRYRSRAHALAAWNAGPGAVKKAVAEDGEVPERWLAFSRKVMAEHRRLRAHLGADRPDGLAAVRTERVAVPD